MRFRSFDSFCVSITKLSRKPSSYGHILFSIDLSVFANVELKGLLMQQSSTNVLNLINTGLRLRTCDQYLSLMFSLA